MEIGFTDYAHVSLITSHVQERERESARLNYSHLVAGADLRPTHDSAEKQTNKKSIVR